jgi:hypothetical protein
MRRIDHFTLGFFARSLQANRLIEDWAPASRPSQEGDPFEDLGEEQIHSWESAWIDLGGEG